MARTKQTARKSTGGMAPRARLCGSGPDIPTPHELFELPEILEDVLVQLPVKDLLFAQQVCREWRSIIRGSPRLQEALFLKPESASANEDGHIIRHTNPLLADVFSAWFSGELHIWIESESRIDETLWTTTAGRLAFLRRDASWRRMLTAQPPLTTYEEAHTLDVWYSRSLSVGSIPIPNGVTMGLVYDRTQYLNGSRFHVVSDGAVFPLSPAKWEELHDDDKSEYATNEQKKECDRVFGGRDVFTLVSGTSRGCSGGSFHYQYDSSIQSAAFEDVAIEMQEKPGGLDDQGWFTVEGFVR